MAVPLVQLMAGAPRNVCRKELVRVPRVQIHVQDLYVQDAELDVLGAHDLAA